MIKFFRKIRQKLLVEKRFNKYLIYAIGEIILVVIGILIALQVSNWNQNRQETNKINAYFEKLKDEVDEQIIETDRLLNKNDTLAKMQRKTLEILASGNLDRISELNDNLGSVATAWAAEYSFEIYDEFMQQGLLTKVKNRELKKMLETFKSLQKDFDNGDIYLNNQYNTLIEPFFSRHINYANVALPSYKVGLVQGGPNTDYESLFNSMELWNVATLKLETTNSRRRRYIAMKSFLEILKQKLEEELGETKTIRRN